MLRSQLPVKQFKTGRECINWKEITEGFEVELNGQKFVVVSNMNVDKMSKSTGKAYKTRRIVIRDVHGNELEIGADSFRKGSFLKRFNKLYPLAEVKAVEEVKEVQAEVVEESDVERQNRMYEILTERGLLQAYSDYEYGKFVDKATMDKLEQVFDIVDGIDMNEVQRLVEEESVVMAS